MTLFPAAWPVSSTAMRRPRLFELRMASTCWPCVDCLQGLCRTFSSWLACNCASADWESGPGSQLPDGLDQVGSRAPAMAWTNLQCFPAGR
jgi:hypothetical protein